ncbi:DUF6907 domain-containing protein [Streptomyces sp. NPDC000878]
MAIQAQPEAPTASPAPREQSLSTFWLVEVMNDLETGQPMLLASSDPTLGDLQVVTAGQVIAQATEQHKKIADSVALALAYEAATKPVANEQPPTWTAPEIDTGASLPITCMVGCDHRHKGDAEIPNFAADLSCTNHDDENQTGLPVFCGDDSAPTAVLSTLIQVSPFHENPARRVPHAAVEVIGDHFLEDLDPDGLAAVIDHFEQRVAAMHVRHAELVRARAAYLGRCA